MILKLPSLPVPAAPVVLGPLWLVATPLIIWAGAAIYVPVMAPSLGVVESWIAGVLMLLAIILSLTAHTLAHWVAARLAGAARSSRSALYLFGDAAQVGPPAPSAAREAVVALGGPIASALLAGATYALWDLQVHPLLDVVLLFAALFNAAIAMVNLMPGFPLDGGRLTRAIVWGLLGREGAGSQLALTIGRLIVAGTAMWGAALLAQPARFHAETGLATLLAGSLFFLGLREPLARSPRQSTIPQYRPGVLLLRAMLASVPILGLLAVGLTLAPLTMGLDAPGGAIVVEPMISVPEEYLHPSEGQFLLTTVISQAPITVGQWLYSRFDPAVQVVATEEVVPPDISPQELMERSFHMLQESELVASVVALQLAGYDASLTGYAVGVLDVVPESPAFGTLQPGDLIIEFEGRRTRTVDILLARIADQEAGEVVTIEVERNGERLTVTTPLMEAREPGGPPRLGIMVETAGLDVELPFPVEIDPEKIVGGPSAGLMFALSIYNLITPGDLTQGHKIAGTGTISLDGTVGPIGGVAQKVAAAERAGAEYFLSPPENYEEARRVARHIRVVRVTTIFEAIDFLRSLPSRSVV